MASVKNLSIKMALNGLYLTGIHQLLAPLTGGIGAILMLHHVRSDAVPDFAPNAHLTVTPDFLDRTLAALRRSNIDIISMDEVTNRLQDTRVRRRFVALTFDDAYRDNLFEAVPVLRSHGAPYTIYVASGLVEGLADIWWEGLEAIVRQQDQLFVQDVSGGIAMDCRTLDEKHQVYGELLDYFSTKMDEREQRRRVRELAWLYKVDLEAARREQIMNWDELQKLSRDPLCTLGAHTIHHYALARLSKQDARHEMLQSARVLEAETGKHARHFAYPYGYPAAAGKREFELARDLGFATAVTTRPGVLHRDHASHETALPRISLNGHFQQTRYTKALMSGAPTFAMNRFRHLNVA